MTADGIHDEHELIRRFREGDEEAFRLLFEQCENNINERIRPLMSKAMSSAPNGRSMMRLLPVAGSISTRLWNDLPRVPTSPSPT